MQSSFVMGVSEKRVRVHLDFSCSGHTVIVRAYTPRRTSRTLHPIAHFFSGCMGSIHNPLGTEHRSQRVGKTLLITERPRMSSVLWHRALVLPCFLKINSSN